MFKSSVKRFLLGTIVSMAATLSAHAAVYTGNWDPAFGAGYSGLGWKGEATFVIPDACLALGPGDYGNGSSCSNFGMKLLSASVSFYDINDLSQTPQETVYFSTPASVFTTLAMGVDANHQLDGVFGLFEYLVSATVDLPFAGGIASQYGLSFQDSIAVLEIKTPNGISYSQSIAPDGSKPLIVFTAVPEPETYALLLAGLGMVVMLSRRRRS